MSVQKNNSFDFNSQWDAFSSAHNDSERLDIVSTIALQKSNPKFKRQLPEFTLQVEQLAARLFSKQDLPKAKKALNLLKSAGCNLDTTVGHIAHSLYARKEYKGCRIALETHFGTSKVQDDLQAILKLEKKLPEEQRITEKALREYQENGFSLVNALVSKTQSKYRNKYDKPEVGTRHRTQESISLEVYPDEIKELHRFLTYAASSKELQKALKGKHELTGGEKFILDFTTAAEHLSECLEAVDNTKQVLKSHKLDRLLTHKEKLDTLLSSLKPFSQVESVNSLLNSSPRDLLKNEQRTLLSDLIQSQKKNQPLLKVLKAIDSTLDELETIQSNLDDEGMKLPLKTLATLRQYSKLNPILYQFLKSETKPSPTVENVCTASYEASQLTKKLNSLNSFLESYDAGDILFTDEVKLNKTLQFKRTNYSQLSIFQNLSGLVQLAKDAIFRGGFAIQPFFTGSYTHAQIVFQPKSDTLAVAEVACDYQEPAITLFDSLTSHAFRPNFNKLLTQEGKKALKKEGISTDYLRKQFGIHIKNHLQANSPEYKKLTNSAVRAAGSYIRQISSGTIQKVLLAILDSLFSPQGLITSGIQHLSGVKSKELQQATTQVSNMFCSEFVARVASAALNDLEKELKKSLKTKQPLFHTILDEDPLSIHPNRLEELIKGYFDKLPQTQLEQLIVEGD